jgi:hypothetical protein
VGKRFLVVAKDADLQGSGMNADSAVVPVLSSIESHWPYAYAQALARQVLLGLEAGSFDNLHRTAPPE